MNNNTPVPRDYRSLAHGDYFWGRVERLLDHVAATAVEPLEKPSIEQMIAVEPSIAHLLEKASSRFECGYANWCQGEPLYRWMPSIAGDFAVNPLLRSDAAEFELERAVLAVFRPGLCDRCECEEEENYDTAMCANLREREEMWR